MLPRHAPNVYVSVLALRGRQEAGVEGDGGDDPGPLVADPDRVGGLTRVEVRHLPGEELDVRAADTRALDVALVGWIRPEQKFESVEMLKRQMDQYRPVIRDMKID